MMQCPSALLVLDSCNTALNAREAGTGIRVLPPVQAGRDATCPT